MLRIYSVFSLYLATDGLDSVSQSMGKMAFYRYRVNYVFDAFDLL
jgi:hypothetical protein